MTSAYKPFAISEFKSGISTYLEPWIRPIDAFDPLVNAYIYRGTINKRSGYSQFGDTLGDGNPVMGIMTHIDESTGIVTLLVATTENLYLYSAGSDTFTAQVLPSGFSGTIENFFNFTNWQPTPGGSSFLFMTNNIDPITLWDGTTATQPSLYIDSAHSITLSNCLDVKVYKQRLLYIRPTLSSSAIPENQTIIWSKINNPTTIEYDVAGNGGFLAAPTGDIIQSAEFIRDVLVVFFTNSTWIFRYTGNDTAPFRWDKVNNSKNTSSPYGSIPYDERCTSIGSTGFIACDGVNVQRYDVPIIDYYETKFQEQFYKQAFSQRYDNINQGWTLYVSQDNIFPLVGSVAPGSDQALIYNFLENTWATYKWSIPMTCLGLFQRQAGTTWADLTIPWENADLPWQSYSTQKAAPILLAGDTTGHVYFMDDETTVVDIYPINGEIIAVGDGGTTYSGTVANPPVKAGTFTATDGTEIFTDNSDGTLTGDLGGTGTIDYTTGAFTLIFNSAVGIAVDITSDYDEEFDIIPDIITTRWNPIVNMGQKVQFGYIDIYYYIASLDPTDPVSVQLKFYVDNSSDPALTKTLTLDGPTNSQFTFKRIYINLIGQFVQMEIDPNVNSFMQFLGFILWVRPAGRITFP